MKVVHPRCAGLDVHKDSVVAAMRVTGADGSATHEVEQFGTTTKELLRLGDWLRDRECTHAAMEASGVYWRPVWHVLEDTVELMLVNARHFRNVPGRKTDVNDATWLSDLLAHGLLRPSFVPPTAQQDIRSLTRTRKRFVQERAQHVLRIQKTLEDANVKLSSVLSDVLGKTGRAVLEAILSGKTRPEDLLPLKQRGVKSTDRQFLDALQGNVRDYHRFELRLHLNLIDSIDEALRQIDGRLEEAIEPFRRETELLTTIPGIGETAAQVLVGEIGVDMNRFPSAAHLRSWVTICPRADRSAGRDRSRRQRPGGEWLKPMLVQAAWAAIRVKGSYFRAQYFRLKARRGPKRAICAVAASILTVAYQLLRTGQSYREIGADHFDRVDRTRAANRHLRRLKALGFTVQISPAPATAA